MIDREQVLHVARLARLQLTDEEVERFGGELSKVLDHIELIAELGDLSDVPPTSHVIDVENALRADEPRPSLPKEAALASAPDEGDGGFRVPSPGAGGEMAS
jgi:aspartyl-tRNA(Asn)/glutamyl-tRNA(Gln) amidotransferase subunit C